MFQCVIIIIREVCHQYWPNTGMVEIREYTLDLLGEEKREGFISRTLSICHKKVLYNVLFYEQYCVVMQCDNVSSLTLPFNIDRESLSGCTTAHDQLES